MSDDALKMGPNTVRFSFVFVSLVFLAQMGFFVLLFLSASRGDFDSYARLTSNSFYLFFALLNLIASVGLVLRRSFSYRFSLFVAGFDSIVDVPFVRFSLILILVLLFSIALLFRLKGHFRKPDRVDTFVSRGLILLPVVYLLVGAYVSRLPGGPGTTSQHLTQEALDQKDESICERISQDGAKSNCLRLLGETKKDPEICGRITESEYHRDKCYLHVADALNDAELCKLIKGDHDKKMCEDFSKG